MNAQRRDRRALKGKARYAPLNTVYNASRRAEKFALASAGK